jgi:DNA-binding LytR/AlgR family response regulator
MTCIIVDDEPLAREDMQYLIEICSDLEIIGTFPNAIRAGEFLERRPVDIIFLDIQMPMVTGLDFATRIPSQTSIIFTTAYTQHALESFDLNALDYLLKPIDQSRLEKAIAKAKKYRRGHLEQNMDLSHGDGDDLQDFLLIRSERQFKKVVLKHIKFIEGLKDYVVIHENGQKTLTAMNLKTIHKKLSSAQFVRVSKSYIVNITYVNSFDSHTIFIDDQAIPLGDIYRKDFLRIWLPISGRSNTKN